MHFSRILTTFQKGYDLEDIFCQTVVSVEYLTVAFIVICIIYELEIPCLEVFSNIFDCLCPTITDVVLP